MARDSLAECIADEICADSDSIIDLPGANIDWLRLVTVIEDAISSYPDEGEDVE